MTWPSVANSQRSYLQSALCAEPELFPTLFGLRLVTDLDYGRACAPTLGHVTGCNSTADPRTLAWIRADCTLVPCAPLRLGLGGATSKGSDGLTPAVQALVKLCCTNTFTGQPWRGERIALRSLTPWTLGLWVAQSQGRWVCPKDPPVHRCLSLHTAPCHSGQACCPTAPMTQQLPWLLCLEAVAAKGSNQCMTSQREQCVQGVCMQAPQKQQLRHTSCNSQG